MSDPQPRLFAAREVSTSSSVLSGDVDGSDAIGFGSTYVVQRPAHHFISWYAEGNVLTLREYSMVRDLQQNVLRLEHVGDVLPRLHFEDSFDPEGGNHTLRLVVTTSAKIVYAYSFVHPDLNAIRGRSTVSVFATPHVCHSEDLSGKSKGEWKSSSAAFNANVIAISQDDDTVLLSSIPPRSGFNATLSEKTVSGFLTSLLYSSPSAPKVLDVACVSDENSQYVLTMCGDGSIKAWGISDKPSSVEAVYHYEASSSSSSSALSSSSNSSSSSTSSSSSSRVSIKSGSMQVASEVNGKSRIVIHHGRSFSIVDVVFPPNGAAASDLAFIPVSSLSLPLSSSFIEISGYHLPRDSSALWVVGFGDNDAGVIRYWPFEVKDGGVSSPSSHSLTLSAGGDLEEKAQTNDHSLSLSLSSQLLSASSSHVGWKDVFTLDTEVGMVSLEDSPAGIVDISSHFIDRLFTHHRFSRQVVVEALNQLRSQCGAPPLTQEESLSPLHSLRSLVSSTVLEHSRMAQHDALDETHNSTFNGRPLSLEDEEERERERERVAVESLSSSYSHMLHVCDNLMGRFYQSLYGGLGSVTKYHGIFPVIVKNNAQITLLSPSSFVEQRSVAAAWNSIPEGGSVDVPADMAYVPSLRGLGKREKGERKDEREREREDRNVKDENHFLTALNSFSSNILSQSPDILTDLDEVVLKRASPLSYGYGDGEDEEEERERERERGNNLEDESSLFNPVELVKLWVKRRVIEEPSTVNGTALDPLSRAEIRMGEEEILTSLSLLHDPTATLHRLLSSVAPPRHPTCSADTLSAAAALSPSFLLPRWLLGGLVNTVRNEAKAQYTFLREILVFVVWLDESRRLKHAKPLGGSGSLSLLLSLLTSYRAIVWLATVADEPVRRGRTTAIGGGMYGDDDEEEEEDDEVDGEERERDGAFGLSKSYHFYGQFERLSLSSNTEINSSSLSHPSSSSPSSSSLTPSRGVFETLVLSFLYQRSALIGAFSSTLPPSLSGLSFEFLQFVSFHSTLLLSPSSRINRVEVISSTQALMVAEHLLTMQQYGNVRIFLQIVGKLNDPRFQHVIGNAYFATGSLSLSRSAFLTYVAGLLNTRQDPMVISSRSLRSALRYTLDLMQKFEIKGDSEACLELAFAALDADLSPLSIDTAVPMSSGSGGGASLSLFSSSSRSKKKVGGFSGSVVDHDSLLSLSKIEIQSILYCHIFRHSLSLQRYDAAYSALVEVPDEDTRRECIQRLVVVLCQDRKANQLCRYPWVGMHEDVERVLWWKARNAPLYGDEEREREKGERERERRRDPTSDLRGVPSIHNTNYYKVLYAFLLNNATNFRSAAQYMYMYALRLERESKLTTVEELEELVNAYLVTINALSQVPSHRWIVRLPESGNDEGDVKSKRKRGQEEVKESGKGERERESERERGATLGFGGTNKEEEKSGPWSGQAPFSVSLSLFPSSSTSLPPTSSSNKNKNKNTNSSFLEQVSLVVEDTNMVVENKRKEDEEEEEEEEDEKRQWGNMRKGSSGRRIVPTTTSKSVVEIVTIEDIRRKFAISSAHLSLCRAMPSYTNMLHLGAADTVSVLVNAGLIDVALSLSLLFSLSLEPVFDGLTDKCIRLSAGEDPTSVHLYCEEFIAGNHTNASASEEAWLFLRSLLIRHDNHTTNFSLTTRVAQRILSQSPHSELPLWLVQLFCGVLTPADVRERCAKLNIPTPEASYESQEQGAQSFANSSANTVALIRLYLDCHHLDRAAILLSHILGLEYNRLVSGQQAMERDHSAKSVSVWVPLDLIEVVLKRLTLAADSNLPESSKMKRLHGSLSREVERLVDVSEKTALTSNRGGDSSVFMQQEW